VVLAVLAVVWVLALTPMMLRKLSERRFSNSVNSFHRQLRGMRRAYPRLATRAVDPGMAPRTATTADTVTPAPSVPTSRTWRPESFERHSHRPAPQTTRRRRVLLILLATMLGLFLLGMIPALQVLWDLSLLAFAATAGYLALLIHIHRRDVERAVKVVDIRELLGSRKDDVPVSVVTPTHRSAPEEMDWFDDDLLGPAFGFDPDQIVVGDR